MGKRISIELTLEQRRQIRAILGRDGATLDLRVEELEERIAPSLVLRDVGDLNVALDGPGDLNGPLDGYADLEAREPVDLRGVAERSDGTYYVADADHAAEEGGYREEFDIDREE